MAGYQSPMMPYPSFMDPDRNTTYMVVPVQNGVVQSPQGPASFSDWSSIQAQQMIAQQLLSCQQSMPQPAPNQENEVLAPSMHLQQMLGLMPYQSFPPIPAMPSVPMTPSRHNSIQGYPVTTPQLATPSQATGRPHVGRHTRDNSYAQTPSHSRNHSIDQTAYRVSKNTSPKKSPVKKDHSKTASPTKRRSPEKMKKPISPAKEAAIQQATLPSPPATQQVPPLDSFDVSSFPQLAPLNPATTIAPCMSRDLSGHSTYYSPLAGFDLSPEAAFAASPELSHFNEAFAVTSYHTTPDENLLQTPPISFESSPDEGLLEDPFLTQSSLTTAFDSKLVASLTRAMAGSIQPTSSLESLADDIPSPHLDIGEDDTVPTKKTTPPSSFSSSSSGATSPAKTLPAPAPVNGEIDLTAAMIRTGVTEADIEVYIQGPSDTVHGKWRCLYPECTRDDFGRRENCRSHVQTHLGDRQFQCPQCGKKFVRQHDLKRHANTHSPQKKYQCPCGRDFVRQDALTRHRQRAMCCGALEGAVRKEGGKKRGRPRKVRPAEEEEEEEEAGEGERARQALGSATAAPATMAAAATTVETNGHSSETVPIHLGATELSHILRRQPPVLTTAGPGMGGSGPGETDFVLFPPTLDDYVQFYD